MGLLDKERKCVIWWFLGLLSCVLVMTGNVCTEYAQVELAESFCYVLLDDYWWCLSCCFGGSHGLELQRYVERDWANDLEVQTLYSWKGFMLSRFFLRLCHNLFIVCCLFGSRNILFCCVLSSPDRRR